MAGYNQNVVFKQEPDLLTTCQSESTIAWLGTGGQTFQNFITNSQIPLMVVKTVAASENNVVCKKEPQPLAVQPETILTQTKAGSLPVTYYCASLGSNTCMNTIKQETDSENSLLSSSVVSNANMVTLKISSIYDSQAPMMTINSGTKKGIQAATALSSYSNISSQNSVGNESSASASDKMHTGTHSISLPQSVGNFVQPRIPLLFQNRVVAFLPVRPALHVRNQLLQKLATPPVTSQTNSPVQNLSESNSQDVRPLRNSGNEIYPVAVRLARPMPGLQSNTNTNATTTYACATVFSKGGRPNKTQSKSVVIPPSPTGLEKMESVKKMNTVSETSYISESLSSVKRQSQIQSSCRSVTMSGCKSKEVYPVALHLAQPGGGCTTVTCMNASNNSAVSSIMEPGSQSEDQFKKVGTSAEDDDDIRKNVSVSEKNDKLDILKPEIVETSPRNKMSDSEFLSDIESCFRVNRMSLQEMMKVLDNGNDVMAVVEPGTIDHKRAKIFCEAAKKHGVCGLKPGIDNSFYTSLISPCITAFETVVFKANVENTLKLREQTIERSETQTVTVEINHVSNESNSLRNENDSSETMSHCDNINPVDKGNKMDKFVKYGDKTQLQKPTYPYDEMESLSKWNSKMNSLYAWKRAVRSLCIIKRKCKDSVFCCYLCDHVSCSLNNLNQHIQAVHFETSNVGNATEHFTCTHCMLVVGNFHFVRVHELSHHLSDFPCYFCGIPNSSRACLLDHICMDHSEVFVCKFCLTEVKGRNEFLKHCWFENHIQSLMSTGYFCLYCTKIFSDSTNLKSHLQECHIDKPVPNIAERICYSCRHVFMDDHALDVHKSKGLHKKTMHVYLKDSTVLPSISKQFRSVVALNKHSPPVKKFTDGIDRGQLYDYDWIWWKEYLLKIKGVMRTVSANDRTVSYPYGELIYTCKVTNSLCNMVDRLPLVMDKLVQTAIEKFQQAHRFDKVYLTEGVVAVLSSVWAYDKLLDIQESVIRLNLHLFCRGSNKFVTSETPNIEINGKCYKYPRKNISRLCAMENVHTCFMPAILDGILQIIFAHFPDLDPSKCLVSPDFWEMVVTVSRTHLLSKALEYVQLKPLPWNDHVKDSVYSFLNKCRNDRLDFGFDNPWKAILKNVSRSTFDSSKKLKNKKVEVSSSEDSVAYRMPCATATSQVSEFDNCDLHEPETNLPSDVVSGPGHKVNDLPIHQNENILSSSQPRTKSEYRLLRELLQGSSLLQQMFDLRFWESEYGMEGLHLEMKTVCRLLKERNEKKKKKILAYDTVKETKDTGLEPTVQERYSPDFHGNEIRDLKVSENQLFVHDSTVDKMNIELNNDSVQEYSDGEPVCKKRRESHVEVGCKYFADEERNMTVISSSIEIESEDDTEPLVTNEVDDSNVSSFDSDKDSEDNDDLDYQICFYDTEILPKWKKSVVVPVVLNRRILEFCTKDEVSIDIYFYCYLCSYKTHDSKYLHEHIATTHFESKHNRKDFVCSHCFKIMQNFDAVRRHELENHLSEFPCYFCGIGFQNLDNMLLHICKMHSVRTFCETCNSGFLGPAEFVKHEHDQASMKSIFGCLYCSITFTTFLSLKTHMLNKHVDQPMSNRAEHVCNSCRHAFMDAQALMIHRSSKLKAIPAINLATLASISKQPDQCLVKLRKGDTEDHQKVSFKKRRWKEFLLSIKDAVRVVPFNCVDFRYSYGKLVYNFEMSRALSHEIDKLPKAIDKLVEITLKRFVQIQYSKHIPLTDHVLKMLATVFVSEEYFAFLSSIDVQCNVDLLSQKTLCHNMKNTGEVLVRKLMYKFPYKKIVRYCAVGDVNREVMPCIIDSLVRFIFAEFPLLRPDVCLISEDFWQMVTLVSRITLFTDLLVSLQLEPFPRNRISKYHIHSFLFKCLSNKIQFGGVDELSSVLKCFFYSKTVYSPGPLVTTLSPGTYNNTCPGSDALPNASGQVNALQVSCEQDALHKNFAQVTPGAQATCLVQDKNGSSATSSTQHSEVLSDFKKQMIDLEFWDSVYGIKHVNISMEQLLQCIVYEQLTKEGSM